MRITTQMLDETARKTGIIMNRHNLLDYVNSGSRANPLLNALPQKSNYTANVADKTRYEKQEKAADSLYEQTQKFMVEEDKDIFKKALSTGDNTELYEEVEMLVEKYNELFSAMKDTTGALNKFYKQSMQDLIEENKAAFLEIGISAERGGSLKLDKEKLKAASLENVEKVLGKDNSFTEKLGYLSSRIADNANAYLESASNSYLPNGNIANNYSNKYDFWG